MKRFFLFWLPGLVLLTSITIYLNAAQVLAAIITFPFPRPVWVAHLLHGISEPADLELPSKDIQVTASDGAQLNGWFIQNQNSTITIYLLHGHGDNRIQCLKKAQWLYKKGYSVLLMDLRGHGKSEGDYCTFGILEKEDVKQIIEEIERTTGSTTWILWGSSLGAAIALQAADLHPHIAGVIAEAPYSRLNSIIDRYVYRLLPLKSLPAKEETYATIEKRIGFPLPYNEPLKSVSKLRKPILFIHGKEDLRIPPGNSSLLYQKSSAQSQLVYLDNANHVNCWQKGDELYQKAVEKFLKQIEVSFIHSNAEVTSEL